MADETASDEQIRSLHKTIRRVTDDMERMAFNTAIAALIELNNTLVPLSTLPRSLAEPMVRMLAPFAPHICEELWERLGHTTRLAHEPWPQWEEHYLTEEEVEIAVQVSGKVRARVKVPADADEETAKRAALADERVSRLLDGKTIKKVIFVPGKLVNFVAS